MKVVFFFDGDRPPEVPSPDGSGISEREEFDCDENWEV